MDGACLHIVIARYREDLGWLFSILRNHRTVLATVYNDGDDFDVPSDLEARVCVKPGDRVPAEPTKYLDYILAHWDCPTDETLVFLQGDPVYHNPTIGELFRYAGQWNKNYQNLTLFPHPPPFWGCSQQIDNGTAPNITAFGADARVWCDTHMDEHFRGEYFKDEQWVRELFGQNNLTLTDMCQECGIRKPCGNILKTYSSMFATNWKHIQRHPKEVWLRTHHFVTEGNRKTCHLTQKDRACIIEYMWSVLLHDDVSV